MAKSFLALRLLLSFGMCMTIEASCPKDDSSCIGTADPEADDNLNLLQVGLSVGAKPQTSLAADDTLHLLPLGLSALAKPQTSVPVVAITYCDEGFAPLWPTFIKCYGQALGCSPGSNVQSCGPSKPMLMDLGLESPQPGKSATHCAAKKARHWHWQQGLSLLSTGIALTPRHVPALIANAMAEQLRLGRDVLRIDADAFLLADPLKLLREDFPDADIISSVDCTSDCTVDCTRRHNGYCDWYHDHAFKKRHNGTDPLAEIGFMLNTGLVYIRSKPQTIALAHAAAAAVHSGDSSYEQTAYNEELAALNCRWSYNGGQPSPGGSKALDILEEATMLGKCDGGLQVVAVQMKTFTRRLTSAHTATVMHPGENTQKKIEMLPQISALCDERSLERARRESK